MSPSHMKPFAKMKKILNTFGSESSDGRAIRKDIVTGTELPDAVEVQSGISLSDRIILSPDDIRSNQLDLVQRRDSHV